VFDRQVFSPDGEAVHSLSSLPVLPQGAIAEMPPCDLLIVLASYAHQDHDTAKNRGRLARAARCVVGHDAGPWLLDGRMATLHWEPLDDFAESFLPVTASREHIVRDGPRLTSAGVMAACDLTLDLVRDTCGAVMFARHFQDSAARSLGRRPSDRMLSLTLRGCR